MNPFRQDPACIATTMVDYYALPQGEHGWPGRSELSKLKNFSQKIQCVQDAIFQDLIRDDRFDPRRFVPFVVRHEFEGLRCSDCAAFRNAVGRPDLEESFVNVRTAFATPEDINDSPDTAPSKRVKELLPGYQKPLLGALAALEIGLTRIRTECPHFSNWLSQLEARAS